MRLNSKDTFTFKLFSDSEALLCIRKYKVNTLILRPQASIKEAAAEVCYKENLTSARFVTIINDRTNEKVTYRMFLDGYNLGGVIDK